MRRLWPCLGGKGSWETWKGRANSPVLKKGEDACDKPETQGGAAGNQEEKETEEMLSGVAQYKW